MNAIQRLVTAPPWADFEIAAGSSIIRLVTRERADRCPCMWPRLSGQCTTITERGRPVTERMRYRCGWRPSVRQKSRFSNRALGTKLSLAGDQTGFITVSVSRQ